MIVGYIIWSITAICTLGIAIYARKAKKPVGFFTGGEIPKVKDIKNYNKAVSNLWIIFSIVFEILGTPLLLCKQNSPIIFITVLGTVFLVIGLILAYIQIEDKYTNN